MIVIIIYLLGDFLVIGRLGWAFSFFLLLFIFINLNDLYRYQFSLDFVSFFILFLAFLIMSFIYNSLRGDRIFFYRIGSFFISFIILVLLVVFLSLDCIVFYFSFEFVVVPIFLMILIIGGRFERLQSGIYLFLYTLVSSMPFLIFLVFFFKNISTLSFVSFFSGVFFRGYWWVFIMLVFLVKLPVFLVHLWLPKAHVEAPLIGSIILAGVLLKLGGYGLFKMQLFSGDLFLFCNSFYVFLGIYGGVVICLVCLSQVDIKSLIAYSSIVHIAPVLCGILTYSWMGWWGSFLIMVSHGICSSGLFYVLSLLYERLGSRSLLVLKGLNIFFPFLTYFWFFLSICNISVPPTFNFYSELVFILRILRIRFLVKLLFGFIFLMVGIYNIFFFVSVNHRVFLSFFSSFHVLFQRELSILFYHCFPLLIFPLFFCLFCSFSLFKNIQLWSERKFRACAIFV